MAPPWPDTKKVKNCIIVKIATRDKREEVFKRRKNLIGKKSSNLALVSVDMGKSIFSKDKIHFNELLTSYQRRLFGRINKFKLDNNYKSLWTVNGKIHLTATKTLKPHFHMIVRIITIVPVVSKNVQTIGTIIWKRYPDGRKRPGPLRRPRSLG